MKATGIVRRVDSLGRIVIPKEICRTFGIREGDSLEIYTDNDSLIFRRYDNALPLQDSLQRLKQDVLKSRDLQNHPGVLNKLYELENLIGTKPA